MADIENVNPSIHKTLEKRETQASDYDNDVMDLIDEREVFDEIRNIKDPEHPLTLEQLNVVDIESVSVNHGSHIIRVEFTPTIPHCSMASLIGLSLQVKMIRSLPAHFKKEVYIKAGTHATEEAINKQLADKERVAAALENVHLLQVINTCLEEEYK